MIDGEQTSIGVRNLLLSLMAIGIVHAAPILFVSLALFMVASRWSRQVQVLCALAVGCVGAFFGPWLLLVLGCLLTGDCL
jgi:hypothetical protein